MIVDLINFDNLAKIMSFLIILIGFVIFNFSKSYMEGEKFKNRFQAKIVALTLSLLFMVSSDNIFALSGFFLLSNLILVSLLNHSSKWEQARNSAKFALKMLLTSSFLLILASFLIYFELKTPSIAEIAKLAPNFDENSKLIVIFALILASIIQCSLIPFHKWLLSSLNAPTPASAIMHAGLINGGGFLLVRFSSLFQANSYILTIIFTIGIFSAILASLWKLMQNDVKKMLACSTVAQMGFMIAQFGLGLFSAAITHLFWHGLFKSYLFLSSAGSLYEKKSNLSKEISITQLVLSLVLALFGSLVFINLVDKDLSSFNTNWVLIVVAHITCTQLIINLFKYNKFQALILSPFLSALSGLIYGLSIKVISIFLAGSEIYNAPYQINSVHIILLSVLIFCWIVMNFRFQIRQNEKMQQILAKFYVLNLNLSQAKKDTITTYRNFYKINK